jgi:hypothetical protein
VTVIRTDHNWYLPCIPTAARGRTAMVVPRSQIFPQGQTYSRLEPFNGAIEYMIYREGVATNENDAPTFRPFYCSCQQHAFFLFGSTLSPLGVPRGVLPGRVTWVHDPAAVTWDGTGSSWADGNNNQAAIECLVRNCKRGQLPVCP